MQNPARGASDEDTHTSETYEVYRNIALEIGLERRQRTSLSANKTSQGRVNSSPSSARRALANKETSLPLATTTTTLKSAHPRFSRLRHLRVRYAAASILLSCELPQPLPGRNISNARVVGGLRDGVEPPERPPPDHHERRVLLV